MRNVISFSLFGDNPKYTVGAIENAKLAPKIYPEWEYRYYVDGSVPVTTIMELMDLGANVIEKRRTRGYEALFWRFECLHDQLVDAWISRDVDSRLNIREKVAVDEWLSYDKTCHIMRDAHNSDLIPIPAGMFGIRNDLVRVKYPYLKISCNRPEWYFDRNSDQYALAEQIWPSIKNDHVCHDHWAHNIPVSDKLTATYGRDPLNTYSGQGVYGHVTSRRKNYPEQFEEGSINLPFPTHSPLDYGLYVGQIILEDNTPTLCDDVVWEYQLRNEKWE